MSTVFRGRYTAQLNGPFVVFLIGMRVNRLRAVHRWWPVAREMPHWNSCSSSTTSRSTAWT
jgi:hypothetical protein